MVSGCLSCILGASLLLCNVVKRANVRGTGSVMPICSFCSETNIVIPTCTSGIFPSRSSPCSLLANVVELKGWGERCLGLPGVAARCT